MSDRAGRGAASIGRGVGLLALEAVLIAVLALAGQDGWAVLVGVFGFLVVVPALVLADWETLLRNRS